jgi:HEPN domain-containing protein
MWMSTPAERWIEQAKYDLDSAKAMLESGRYLYVLFCCQQAVEKMLKALIARRSNECPPRIHALVRLAETAMLDLSDERLQFLRELSNYYIQTRYPEEIPFIAARLGDPLARQILEQTEETVQWLTSMT